MNILLLDDEAPARETIKNYLLQMVPEEATIREADSLAACLQLLEQFKPDLALLDINLPDGLSFDLLQQIGTESIPFKIIFISAHEAHAIKAFKFSAVDYILKPINLIEFREAVARALQGGLTPKGRQQQLGHLLSTVKSPEESSSKLILTDQDSIHLVAIAEIVRCSAESNYTQFYMQDGSRHLVSRTLKEYDELLRGRHFFRPHRSHLINLRHFKKYDKRDGGMIIMSDGSEVPIPPAKKDILLQLLQRL